MTGRAPEPCDVPDPGHDGAVRFYVTGWRCDAHSPWAVQGLPAPAPGPGPIYTYRAAPAAETTHQENGQNA
ncbi:hypothetical protein [Streptomyces fumanus]|uniref:hypothetical protein n=1 Tax=Streptomyces fumanus TaxID=67302 RepID=UPI0033E4812B